MFNTWDQALHMRDKLSEVSVLAMQLSSLSADIVDDFDNHKRCATTEAQLRETLKELQSTLEGLNI
jgi:hypothetical protein